MPVSRLSLKSYYTRITSLSNVPIGLYLLFPASSDAWSPADCNCCRSSLILSSDNLPLIRDRLLLSSHLYVSLVLFRPGTFAWLLKSSNDYLKHPATISIATSSSAFVLGWVLLHRLDLWKGCSKEGSSDLPVTLALAAVMILYSQFREMSAFVCRPEFTFPWLV